MYFKEIRAANQAYREAEQISWMARGDVAHLGRVLAPQLAFGLLMSILTLSIVMTDEGLI